MSIVNEHLLKIAKRRIEDRGKYPSDMAVAKELQKLKIKYTERGVTMKFPKKNDG